MLSSALNLEVDRSGEGRSCSQPVDVIETCRKRKLPRVTPGILAGGPCPGKMPVRASLLWERLVLANQSKNSVALGPFSVLAFPTVCARPGEFASEWLALMNETSRISDEGLHDSIHVLWPSHIHLTLP